MILINGIDAKSLTSFLKYIRSSISDLLFQSLDSKDMLHKYLDINLSYFDFLEFSFCTCMERITKGEISLDNVDLTNEELMQIKNNSLYTYDDINGIIDTIYTLEELRLQAKENLKQLNEAIENSKMKNEFFSNLSHELRTPLNVILGTLQLVDMYSSQSSDPIIEKNKKYYKIMRQNCYRLLRLVNNIIDLTKLDAGFMTVDKGNYDVVSIVSKIADSVSDYIENKGIEFEYCSKTDQKIIACDPDKIERILLNLLSNSAKFTDSGGKIQVSIWDKDDKIYISIKDNGIGIPKDKQNMVFSRFAQIDKSLSRNHQGSGIGLSIVKSLVDLHGGIISLISDAGKGCEFIIELPIKQLSIAESSGKEMKYSNNNKIEVIKIEFSDIYA
jgi:signal transduction histidine kinase